MGVQCVEACRVDEKIDYGVDRVSCDESLTNCIHAQVAIDFTKLRYDKFVVDTNVDDEKYFISQIQCEKDCHDLPVVKVILQCLTWLECEVKVADKEFYLVLHALHNLKHLCSLPLVLFFCIKRSLSFVRFGGSLA